MLIIDFHTRFTSIQEKSRLFEALRRLSRMESPAFEDGGAQWPEWPPIVPQCPRPEMA